MSNLSHLRSFIIPKLVNLFEAAYHTLMTDELKVNKFITSLKRVSPWGVLAINPNMTDTI